MRRLISLVSAIVALVGLGFVLVNATTVDRRPPSVRTVALSAPAGDPRIAQTVTAIDIEFSEPVRAATAESRFRIDPVIDGAFAWNGSTAIFTPSRKLPLDTTFTISIAPGVEDLEGNIDPTGLEEWTFATVGPPVVLRSTPADGADGVALDGTIELSFDRLMDTASVEAAITIEPHTAIRSNWRGSVVTLSLGLGLSPGLAPGTTYTVRVGSDASDTGGSRLGAPFQMRFTTVGSGLGIVAAIPADGVAGIGIGSAIAIRFDGPIDPDSIAGAIHVTPAVDGTIRLVNLGGDGTGLDAATAVEGGNTLVLVPSGALAEHTTYTVTLDPVVSRLGDGTAVTSGRTWSFTTGAPTPSGQNQIGFLSARSGVGNVWVMNPDGTNQRQLTTELLPVSSFDVTSDGARIAYAAGGVVKVMAVDGTELRTLTTSDGRLEYAPSILPGNEGVVLARRSPTGADLGYWLAPFPGAPGDEHQLVGHGAPMAGSASVSGDAIDPVDGTPPWTPRLAIEPGGRTALLVTASGEAWLSDLTVPDLGNPANPPIRLPWTAGAAPAWVPARDAFVVAAASTTGGSPALVSVQIGGRSAPIVGTSGANGRIDLAADGSLAFVVRGSDGATVLRLLSTAGNVSDIETALGRDDRWPSFAPDGLTLLVSRTLQLDPSVSDGIWRLDLPTRAARRLTFDGADARWIP